MKLEDAIKSTNFKGAQHKATLNIMYTAYWFKSHVSNTLKAYGITAEQYNVMRILNGKHPEPMCVRDIGSRMIEKSSNVPRILVRLVSKKLIKKITSKEDKRESLISLTDKGAALLEKANDELEMLNNKITGITEKEAEILNELLEKLRKED